MGNTVLNGVREFIRKFVNNMPIAPDQVQIGVAQFATAPTLVFDLNTHAFKESMADDLSKIKPRPASQPVNIGAALEFVRNNMLRPERGSRLRDGVPSLVLLLTSKKSTDSVDQAAEGLQRLGVLTLAAGTKNADEAELKKIAFDPSLVYMMKDFRQLLRQPQMVVSPLTTLSGVVITETPTEPGILGHHCIHYGKYLNVVYLTHCSYKHANKSLFTSK